MPLTYVLAIVVFTVGVDSYIVAAVLPAVADDLGESIAAVGLLASAYALPTAILAPLLGPLSDRRGRRFAIVLGMSIFSIAAFGCIVAPTLGLLLVARAINGVGAAIAMPAAFAAGGDLAAPGQRARAMGLLAGMYPLSTLLGLPLGALAAIAFGWRGSFAFILAVALVALGLVAWRLPSGGVTHADGERSHLATLQGAIRERGAMPTFLVAFLWLTATFGLFVYMAEFVHRTFSIPVAEAGLVYVVVGLVGVIATRRADRVIARIGARRTVLAGMAVFIAAAFLLPFTAVALPATILLFSCWAFATWTAIPAMQFIVSGLSTTARGTLLAFLTSAINFGAVVGPIVTGRVLEAGGFAWAGPWAALLGVIALTVAWRALPEGAETPATTEPAIVAA